jgi:hypothetical protein
MIRGKAHTGKSPYGEKPKGKKPIRGKALTRKSPYGEKPIPSTAGRRCTANGAFEKMKFIKRRIRRDTRGAHIRSAWAAHTENAADDRDRENLGLQLLRAEIRKMNEENEERLSIG